MLFSSKLRSFEPPIAFVTTEKAWAELLRWHVCRVNFARKIFFEPRIFLREMLRNFPRNVWAFVLWVRKNPRKIPSKFSTKFSKFPCEKSKKFTDELLQERREKELTPKKHRKRKSAERGIRECHSRGSLASRFGTCVPETTMRRDLTLVSVGQRSWFLSPEALLQLPVVSCHAPPQNRIFLISAKTKRGRQEGDGKKMSQTSQQFTTFYDRSKNTL